MGSPHRDQSPERLKPRISTLCQSTPPIVQAVVYLRCSCQDLPVSHSSLIQRIKSVAFRFVMWKASRMGLLSARAPPPVTRAAAHLDKTWNSNLHLMLHGYPFLHTSHPPQCSRGAVRTDSIHSHSSAIGVRVVGQLRRVPVVFAYVELVGVVLPWEPARPRNSVTMLT